MQIDKNQIIDLLRQRGETQKADQADRELPNEVDPQADGNLLERFGLNPQELITKFIGGKIPGF